MEEDEKSEGRFSRWSQRKIAVARQEAIDGEVETEETLNEEQESELQAELQANHEAAAAVDLESLNEDSDFSVFMKAGVPELLKKQAMTALWRTNPIFANVDGLVDYDDDFASPDLIMKTFKSAYQAGRGYLDLFKEDEEAGEEDVAVDAEQEQGELINEEEHLSGDNDAFDNGGVDEADEILVQENEAADEFVEDGAPLDQEPLPKVSLRKRLELERQS